MKIQNLLLPEIGICTEQELFFRKEEGFPREVELLSTQRALRFQNKGMCTFDTYFNGLSIQKWKKYTMVGNISLCLELQGSFEVILTNCERIGGKVYTKQVGSGVVKSKDKTTTTFPYQLYEHRGILAFSLRALEQDSLFWGGWYDAEIKPEDLWETNIAINICTFRREPFVMRNLDILRRSIACNESDPLHGHLKVFISDNGKTLPCEQLNDDFVHVVANKNVGGAGGFTRGLIEIVHDAPNFPATHALMMDDDVVVEPESLFRTYMLLRCRKKQYENVFVGGAMLRLDDQATQVESGASWNAGRLISNKAQLNLRHLSDCLLNEHEEYTEYNAWWYCCTPMSVVSAENLPLPIFIRGDDLEYGLRNMSQLVLMNGICVWHEAFENKYSSFLQYYILRNLLYDNALHFPQYRISSFLLHLYKSVAREIVYYRYKNVELILRGVEDYFRGVDFLRTTDGETLHKQIMDAGYKSVPVEELKDVAFHIMEYNTSMNETESFPRKLWRYITVNGYLLPAKSLKGKKVKTVPVAQCRPINFYRQKKVLNYDPASGRGFVTEKSWGKTVVLCLRLVGVSVKWAFAFPRAKQKFRNHAKDLMSEEFWSGYLMIDTKE